MITRPLLASPAELEDLKYPLLVTKKIDGIRCLKINGCIVSRNFKPIPNDYIRSILQNILPDNIDGELILKSQVEETVCQDALFSGFEAPTCAVGVGSPLVDFNSIQSAVMSVDGEPDFVYCAFDLVSDTLNEPYSKRINRMEDWYSSLADSDKEFVELVKPISINCRGELEEFETECISAGYEGIMLRKPDGKYKCGRSTSKEQILLKVKRFKDSEGEIVGFEERMHNTNEQEEDEFGLAKRSSKKDGLVGSNTLGSLIVKIPNTDIEFGIGTGFDDSQRKEIWDNKSKYLGKLVVYKFQELSKDGVPRFPVYKGVRHLNDL